VTGGAGGPTLFENLGFSYVGPIDGHDLDQLLPVLRAAKTRATGPVLIHVLTTKGKGYAPAENAADKYHGVAKFDVASGAQNKSKPNAPSYTSIFGKALTQEADQDPKIVGVTAAMPSGTGIDILAKSHPTRVFDVGIAEQHGVTFAAGLAAGGLKPFCAIYSTFLVATAAAHDDGPIAFRYPRGEGVGIDLPEKGQPISIGKGRIVEEGSDVAILSFGAHLSECRKASEILREAGVSATLADARFAKPLDHDLIIQLLRHHKALVTVEQGAEGGFGAQVLHYLAREGRLDGGCAIRTMTLPDRHRRDLSRSFRK